MKNLFRLLQFFSPILCLLILLLLQSACVVPPQDFPVNSALWKKANPELVNPALALASQQSHRILVGVLDAGIDYNAPRLTRHLRLFPAPLESGRTYGLGWDALGKDFFPGFQLFSTENPSGQDEDLSEFLQLRDHGTHVAQLVTLNDPAIGLIPVRVIPIAMEDFETLLKEKDPAAYKARVHHRILDSIVAGIRFAVENGAAVINMSIGFSLEEIDPEYQEGFIRRIQNEVVPKIQNEWKNTLLVVAAGNESMVLTSPIQCIPATIETPDLLSVGALKNHGTVAAYSNQGRFVDLYVRGTDITSTVPYRESTKESRAKMSGTSMASPIAAHVAAQLKILRPELSPRELRALMLNTADIKTLPTEIEEDSDEPSRLVTVRVMNIPRAKYIARTGLGSADGRARWLTPPFAHGHAPHP